MTIKMSEARYNDLVYMTLKKLFFENIFGEGHCPRECDIRICMQMGHKEMLLTAGPEAMILSPTEVSPRSHTTFYDINTDIVFDEIITYMESHWLKQTCEEVWGCSDVKTNMKKFYEDMIPDIMKIEENKCGVTNPVPGPN